MIMNVTCSVQWRFRHLEGLFPMRLPFTNMLIRIGSIDEADIRGWLGNFGFEGMVGMCCSTGNFQSEGTCLLEGIGDSEGSFGSKDTCCLEYTCCLKDNPRSTCLLYYVSRLCSKDFVLLNDETLRIGCRSHCNLKGIDVDTLGSVALMRPSILLSALILR
ncbi:hypothetical protein Tco_0186323 [Tanacetum coccineum]